MLPELPKVSPRAKSELPKRQIASLSFASLEMLVSSGHYPERLREEVGGAEIA
jgi:hypothetical protein